MSHTPSLTLSLALASVTNYDSSATPNCGINYDDSKGIIYNCNILYYRPLRSELLIFLQWKWQMDGIATSVLFFLFGQSEWLGQYIVKQVSWFKSSLLLRIQNKHTNKY
jgi:hypothetical protein